MSIVFLNFSFDFLNETKGALNTTMKDTKYTKYDKKIQKRQQKLEKKRRKAKGVDNRIVNYTVIRYKTSDYVPLNKIGFFGKIAVACRYLFDQKYKRERLLRQRQKQEEELLLKKIRLKKFILSSLEKIPSDSEEIILQIDKAFTDVLQIVLNTTAELNSYYWEEIKINKNYLKFIKNPHKLIRFVPEGFNHP